MKKALLSTLLLILAISSSSILIAQVTENFDLFTNGSYGNHTYNGWEITNGLSETASKSYLGTGRSIRLRNSGSPSLQSPSKPNGIGTVSFWYRTWDGAPAISKVYIEISDDSTTWSKVDSLSSLTNQIYVNYVKIINSPTAKFLRITPSTEERLLLDEFSISDNASGCSGFHRDTMELTICSFDSINFRGTFYSSAGYYNDTLYSTCDTIFTLNLNSTAYTEYEVFDTICSENDSLLFNGSYLKSAGTYYDTISRLGDCDSVIKLELSLEYCHIPCSDLFISEYYEGSSGNNKAIEIYNPTNSTVDLSSYSLIKYTNGGPSITTINLSGMLASKDVFVITHSSADSGAITFHADLRNSSVISFNGNDPIELQKSGFTIDIVGVIGSSANFGNNRSLVRKTIVKQGKTNYDVTEWINLTPEKDSLIGMHIGSCSLCPTSRDTTTSIICEGDSATNGFKFYNSSGVFSDTMLSSGGCDSIRVLDLTVNLISKDTIQDTISAGTSFTFGSQTIAMSGIYSDTVQSSLGCDSITTLELIVTPSSDTIFLTIVEDSCVIICPPYFSSMDSVVIAGLYCGPYHGTLTYDTTTWCITYKPDTNFVGYDSSCLVFMDTTSGLYDTLPIFIVVLPVIDTIQLTISVDSTFTLCPPIIGNLSNLANFNLTCSPINGTLTIDPITGCMTYQPDSCYSGNDTICIAFCDSSSVCDSTIIFIEITPNAIDTLYDTICQGSSIQFGTQTLTATGNYSDTSQNYSGCDSITVMQLLVNIAPLDTIFDTICRGSSITFGTRTLTMSGNYSDTSQTASGCDSISVMTLLANDYIRDTLTDTICQGSSIMFGTQALTMSGNYSDTSQTASGCDSISVMALLVNDYIRDTLADTICQGSSIMFGTRILIMSGNYSDTSQTAAGCDSIAVFQLVVNDYIRDTLTDTICQGASIIFGTRTLTMSGNYSDTSQTIAGCDSIAVMSLFVNAAPRDTVVNSICSWDTAFFGSGFYTVTGFYNDTTQLSTGCDSITTLDLRVILIRLINNVTLCPGVSYTVDTNVYTRAGTYSDVLSASSGCDSTIITNLSYHLTSIGNRNYLICKGDSIQVLGNWYFTDSVVRDTIIGGASTGCDSIVLHDIKTKTVSPPLNLGPDIVACDISSVTVFASSAYDTYNWSNGGTTNSLSVSGTVSGIGSTDYILKVTQVSSGCSAVDTVNITFKKCVGITDNDADLNVNLYPNPASDFLTIDIYDKHNEGNLTLSIVNSIGQVVVSKPVQSINEKVVMDVSNLPQGLYFVRISSDKISMTKKIIIQN